MKKLQLSLKRRKVDNNEGGLVSFTGAESQGSLSESLNSDEGVSSNTNVEGTSRSSIVYITQFSEHQSTQHGEGLCSSHENCNTSSFSTECNISSGTASCIEDGICHQRKHFPRPLVNGQEHEEVSQVFTSERSREESSHGVQNSLQTQRTCGSNTTVVELHQMKGYVSMKRQTSLLSFFQKQSSRPHRKSQISSECRCGNKSSRQCISSSSLPQPPSLPPSPLSLPSPLPLYNKPVNKTNRTCPFYKKVPGTSFTVDAFSYGSIPKCSSYFLSHFHSDHYMGLTRKFQHPVYCSKVTANLVKQQLKVSTAYVNGLYMNKSYVLDGVEVIFLDANHCPGSVMILFKLPSGKNYLHTGDFRFSDVMLEYGPLLGISLTQVFLDTTYCSPQYDFPKQDDVIAFVVDRVLTTLESHPNTLIVCGTYTVGKEKVFMAIAEALCQRVCVYKEKKAILDCLEDARISSSIRTDLSASNVHVLPMARLTLESLTAYLGQYNSKYTTLLAFKPTGWTHSKAHINMGSIKPLCRGPVTIYGVPYSEHSSFSELRRFVQFIRPQKVIPTVNNFSAKKREEMQRTFQQWLSKPGSPPKWKQRTLNTAFTITMS